MDDWMLFAAFGLAAGLVGNAALTILGTRRLESDLRTHRVAVGERLERHADRLAAVENKLTQMPPPGQCGAQNARLATLEARIAHVPTHDDLRAIRADLAGVAADLREAKGQLSQLARGVDLIQQHLMAEDK